MEHHYKRIKENEITVIMNWNNRIQIRLKSLYFLSQLNN